MTSHMFTLESGATFEITTPKENSLNNPNQPSEEDTRPIVSIDGSYHYYYDGYSGTGPSYLTIQEAKELHAWLGIILDQFGAFEKRNEP